MFIYLSSHVEEKAGFLTWSYTQLKIHSTKHLNNYPNISWLNIHQKYKLKLKWESNHLRNLVSSNIYSTNSPKSSKPAKVSSKQNKFHRGHTWQLRFGNKLFSLPSFWRWRSGLWSAVKTWEMLLRKNTNQSLSYNHSIMKWTPKLPWA